MVHLDGKMNDELCGFVTARFNSTYIRNIPLKKASQHRHQTKLLLLRCWCACSPFCLFPLLSACVLAVSITSQAHLLPAEERLLQELQKWKNWSTCPLQVSRVIWILAQVAWNYLCLHWFEVTIVNKLQLSIIPMPNVESVCGKCDVKWVLFLLPPTLEHLYSPLQRDYIRK